MPSATKATTVSSSMATILARLGRRPGRCTRRPDPGSREETTPSLLASASDLDVVGEAANGREALDLVNALAPDVVLMDLAMPVMDGAEATARLRDEASCVQVVVLTGDGGSPLAEQALEGGAISCVLKDARPETLTQAVRDAADGKGSVDDAALKAILERRRRCPGGDLTHREREVLELLAEGLSNRQIAASLGLRVGTVRQHVGSIISKLDAPNRTAAAILAMEKRLI